MTKNLIFYGERGIVNGLVLDIWKDLKRVKAVLKEIDWCGATVTDWIENLEKVTFFVEPGFSKFGQPDLVLICDLKDGSKRWLFVEFKATPYHASAMKNSKGMSQKGYNSSINGQLSLNYRLALALERYSRGLIVIESPKIFQQYQKGLSDYNKGPRTAGKPQLIEKIIKPYFTGLRIDRTYFIAITRNSSLNPIDIVPKDLLPLIVDEAGKDIWAELAAHFGFLSLERLDLQVLNLMKGYFRQGCLLHIGPWSQDPKPEDFIDAPNIKTINWKKFPETWVKKVDSLAQCIKENIDPWGKGKRWNGSYSFIVKGKTIGKLSLENPEDPVYVVGFSVVVPNVVSYAKFLGKPERSLTVPSQQPFLIVRTNKPDEICEVMGEFLRNFEPVKDSFCI